MKDLFCHNFDKMDPNVNTKCLQRTCGTGEITRQCAVQTKLKISFFLLQENITSMGYLHNSNNCCPETNMGHYP
jgi:hypothetical protein